MAQKQEVCSTGSKWHKLPKVELHVHLEGCVRFSTVLDEFEKHGIPLPAPRSDVAALREYFLVTKPVKSLMDFLTIMDREGAILRDTQTLTRISKEAVIDRANQGVKLVEFRYSPSYVAAAGKTGMSFDEIQDAIKIGINEGIEECQRNGNDIYVGIICIAIGVFGDKQFQETVDFAIRRKSDFVGFDIAGCETDLAQYKKFMDQIYAAGIHITIHAGEDAHDGKPENVRMAIQDLHAERIGHGVQIQKDASVYKFVRDKKIHLEISPVSNWMTSAVTSLADHPVSRFYKDGMNISINTDDPCVFAIDLIEEYELLHQTFGFVVADFFAFNRNALEASFAPKAIKDAIRLKYFSEEREKHYLENHV